MKATTLKSMGAILAGFIIVVLLSIATDVVLYKTDIMKIPFHNNPDWFIVVVIIYRSGYAVIGSYITARLAPERPMRLVLIGGLIGFALSVIGAVTMWDTPPHWYPVSLIVLSLPSAWTGGTLYLIKSKK